MKTKFYAVIHVEDELQVMRNITRAVQAEADGVFLINHKISAEDLISLATIVPREFPDLWMGVNRLGHKWSRIFEGLPKEVRGVWADNGHIEPDVLESEARTIQVRGMRWGGRYFGGVAFKTQRQVSDEEAARLARWAVTYVDVITTSGPATGSPPALSKIQAMRAAIPPMKELAIASGITPENVGPFLPYVNHLLVATGVSDSFSELSLSRMQELVKVIRES